jgi:hypothetical protein
LYKSAHCCSGTLSEHHKSKGKRGHYQKVSRKHFLKHLKKARQMSCVLLTIDNTGIADEHCREMTQFRSPDVTHVTLQHINRQVLVTEVHHDLHRRQGLTHWNFHLMNPNRHFALNMVLHCSCCMDIMQSCDMFCYK